MNCTSPFSQVLIFISKSLAAHTTLLPTEISHPTIYTPLISQSLFHSITNNLHHRLISNPAPMPQELLSLNQTIDAWEDTIPTYFQLDSSAIQSSEAFLFARYRLSWRSWNLQIILFRPAVLQLVARRRNSKPSDNLETIEELDCRKKCILSTRAKINSISDFEGKGMVSRLSTWYMLYVVLPLKIISSFFKMNLTHDYEQLFSFSSRSRPNHLSNDRSHARRLFNLA